MKTKKQKTIDRPGDLAPTGIRSTIKGTDSFNDAFEHIYYEGLGVKKRFEKSPE
jgi:hypothetical protein